MAFAQHVFAIPRSDEPNEQAILVQVTAQWPKSLSLTLVATDNNAGYKLKLRNSRIGDLRDSETVCPVDEWENILRSVLLEYQAAIEDVDASAEVSGSSISIVIWRRGAGINQRLGTLTLAYSKEESDKIDLFGWTVLACRSRDTVRKEIAKERARTDAERAEREKTQAAQETQRAEIDCLRALYDELTTAKTKDEVRLLANLVPLINEKKEENRRLIKDMLNKNAATAASQIMRSSRGKGKRKEAPPLTDDSGDDAFEAFDTMAGHWQNKKIKDQDDASDEPQTTPDGDGDATQSESLNVDGDSHVRMSTPPSRSAGLRRRCGAIQRDGADFVLSPPQARSLGRLRSKPAARPPPSATGNSETESGEDEEL